ncbi:hypothetical protein [Streptomyces hirsutus]|uniref:hypothetical protein n=1 Tax=Streptomyces hirsutus TaxID=35620 RepID=UPI0036983B90
MIADAFDTIFVLGWALLAWVAVFSFLGTVLLLGVIAVVWSACAAVWRLIRRQPHLARDDYEEAA